MKTIIYDNIIDSKTGKPLELEVSDEDYKWYIKNKDKLRAEVRSSAVYFKELLNNGA